jgi:hypothetical protein
VLRENLAIDLAMYFQPLKMMELSSFRESVTN